MIYYICITNNVNPPSVADYAKTAISQHTDVGNGQPNMLNEPCVLMAVSNKAALDKLEFKPNDMVRLAVNGMKDTWYNRFDISSFTNVKEIFDSLTARKVNISPIVIYC